MQPSLYVALSGQIALQKRLETIAHNMANTTTAGFRSEEVKFSALVSTVPPDPAAFATSNGTFISRNAGELTQTQNPFDIAVKGDAWFAISIGGQTAYTRDGRMQMLPTGELRTLNGHPILDTSGGPITLDPGSGVPEIGADGNIVQNGQQFGSVGLYRIPENANLTRAENSAVIPSAAAEPVVDFTRVGVLQGFIESSNVNPIMEMTHLITVQRSFEALTNSIMNTESTYIEGIRTLGATS